MSNFLTFGLGEEVFALPIELVNEVLDYATPFKVPNAPNFLLGLMDVRGQSIPVIDLRRRLGLMPGEITQDTRILSVEIAREERNLLLGLLVDHVYEVADIDRTETVSAPEIGSSWKSDYIDGIARGKNGFILLVDLVKLLASDQKLASIAA